MIVPVFTVIILVLAVSAIVISAAYIRLERKFTRSLKQNQHLRFHLQEKSIQKINSAKEQSMKIISEAVKQAEEILKRAELLKTDTTERTKNELNELLKQQHESLVIASGTIVSSFEETLKQLEQDDINLLNNISKDLENTALKEVKQFEKQLENATVGQQSAVDEKIQEAFRSAQSEIVSYKQNRIKLIDQELYSVLQEVTKDVIGKRLSFEDHRTLIMAALERAKKEMIFS